MARIVYGVSGECRGHGGRSREVLSPLAASGHEVKVVTGFGPMVTHLARGEGAS